MNMLKGRAGATYKYATYVANDTGAYQKYHLECESFHAILSCHLFGLRPFSTCAFCQLHSARDMLCSHIWTQSQDKDLV